MLDQLDALRALRSSGTTAAAARHLRISQSAVSKRIAALEAEIGLPLTEPVGRGLRLTPAAERLLSQAEPLVVRLRDALRAAAAPPEHVALGATDSLWCSWLPAALVGLPGPRLRPHAHRGPLLVEKVRRGALDLALCAALDAPDLRAVPLGQEPFVLVGEGEALWCVEKGSLTWEAIGRKLERHHPGLRPTDHLESFAALARLAHAGLGRAILPAGLAEAAGLSGQFLSGVTRPVTALVRPGVAETPWMEALLGALVERAAVLLQRGGLCAPEALAR